MNIVSRFSPELQGCPYQKQIVFNLFNVVERNGYLQKHILNKRLFRLLLFLDMRLFPHVWSATCH